MDRLHQVWLACYNPKHFTHRWCQIFAEAIILGKRGLAMVIVAGRALLIAAEHLVAHRTRHDTVSITGQQLDAHAQHYPKEGSSRSGSPKTFGGKSQSEATYRAYIEKLAQEAPEIKFICSCSSRAPKGAAQRRPGFWLGP